MTRLRLSVLVLSFLAVFGLGAAGVSCAPLSPAGKAALSAAEPAILAADTFACDETAMIPVVGAALEAVACPLEVGAVKMAIDSAVKSTPAPAPAPAASGAADAGAPDAGASMASGVTARLYRAGPGGARRVVAKTSPGAACAVQFHLDQGGGGALAGGADGGAPDAGADGGR